MMVVEGDYKISEIAEKLNYSTSFAFSNAFSAKFGCSPRSYRKRHIQNASTESEEKNADLPEAPTGDEERS